MYPRNYSVFEDNTTSPAFCLFKIYVFLLLNEFLCIPPSIKPELVCNVALFLITISLNFHPSNVQTWRRRVHSVKPLLILIA